MISAAISGVLTRTVIGIKRKGGISITWIISLLALVGVVLNIYKDQRCFIIWACTNFFWMIYDWRIGAHAQSMLFAVYFIMAIWGLYKWKK